MAKSNLEKMLAQCAKPVEPDGTNDDLINAQRKSVLEVTYELVRQVTCPTDSLREEVCFSEPFLSLEGYCVACFCFFKSVMEP